MAVRRTAGSRRTLVRHRNRVQAGRRSEARHISWQGRTFFAAKDVSIAELPDQPYIFSARTPSVQATIDIDPDVLNPKSNGKWITCYIELPQDYRPQAINVSSVFFSRTIRAEPWPWSVGDCDLDGIPDFMVTFDRQQVLAILAPGDALEVLVTGQVGGDTFGGTDTVRVLAK